MTKVYVLLHNGFEEIEALTIVDYLRRANIKVTTVSMNEELDVDGDHGIIVKGDILFKDLDREDIDLLYIPGGYPGTMGLMGNDDVLALVKYLKEKDKYLSAMCAGPMVLNAAGVLKESQVTSYPSVRDNLDKIASYSDELVVVSDKVITSRGPATAVFLALELIELIKGSQVREQIEKGILFDLI